PPPRGGRTGSGPRDRHGPRTHRRRRIRPRDQLPGLRTGADPARPDGRAGRRPARRGVRCGGRIRPRARARHLRRLRRRAARPVHRTRRRSVLGRAGGRPRPGGGLPAPHRPHRLRRRGPLGTAPPVTPTDASAARAPQARPAARAPRTVGPPPSPLRRTLRYAGHTTRMTVTNIFFMLFTLIMPVGMYLLFGSLMGDLEDGQVRGLIMVNMAAYGGLGAAVTAGT